MPQSVAQFLLDAQEILEFDLRREWRPERRKMFWERLYHDREEADAKLAAVLRGIARIGLVTGHVGSGKSTFLRAKYERAGACTGILVDMEHHAGRIGRVDEGDLPLELRNILLEHYNASIARNLRSAIRDGLPEPRNRDFELDYRLSEVDQDELKSEPLLSAGNRWFARSILKHLRDIDYVADFADEFAADLEREERDGTSLRARELIGLLELEPAIRLHRILFEAVGEDTPHVIAVDNIDALPFGKIERGIVDALADCLGAANAGPPPPYASRRSPVVALLAVRDENLPRLRSEGAGALRIQQIVLGESGYLFDGADEVAYLPLSWERSHEIVMARLDLLGERVDQDQPAPKVYRALVQDCWFDRAPDGSGAVARVSPRMGSLQTAELANHSLRRLLSHMHDSTARVISMMEERGELSVDHPATKSCRLLKGTIVHSFWRHQWTGQAVGAMEESIREELSAPNCCSYRVVLTYLAKRRVADGGTRIGALMEELIADFGYTREALLRCLFRLYKVSDTFGEFISIHQPGLISSPDEISDRAGVVIQAKGRLFAESVLQHLDFLGRVANPPRRDFSRALVERGLEAAVTYLENTVELVEALAVRHVSVYNRVTEKWRRDMSEEAAFARYQKKYALKEQFHLERVANSHRESIKSYLTEVLWRRGESLLLTGDELAEIAGIVSTVGPLEPLSPGRKPTDAIMEATIEPLDAESPIKTIWALRSRYNRLQQSMFRVRRPASTEDGEAVA